jgi:secondary thiamine-phosphate synthase enzyme
MLQATEILQFQTARQGLFEVTADVGRWVADQEIRQGLLTVFCRHTSASLLIQESAATAAREDLERFFAALAPEAPDRYAHDDEGPDDMPAHIRSALTQTQISIPVVNGALALGVWQGLFLFEHRRGRHVRELALHLLGE